ncbi:MAG: membrane dipeptidase [Bacteroidetes bacterium]|nr:MAG: membrane dipeptidase [Bacteroidota bacterium]
MKRFSIVLISLFAGLSVTAQDYMKIHQKAILVDTHNDVLSSVTMAGMNIDNNLKGKTHSDLNRFKQGGVDVEFFSIFCDERFGKDTAFKFANIEIDSLYAIAKRNPDKMSIVTTPNELDKAIKEKKLAAMIGVEGGHMIEDKIENLDSLFKRGARYMTLTWNNSTSWASSAKDESKGTVPNPTKGLNDFGKQIVKRMNELGMLVDLSHVGEETFWDAIQLSTKPVLVSHSSVYNLCPVARNLKDDQIKAVGKNGGVICVNFYSGFIDSTYERRIKAFIASHKAEYDSLKNAKAPEYEINGFFSKKYPSEASSLRPPLSMLIDHIDYMVKLIGADHVGLGSDFDGIESAPQGLDDVTCFPLITKALLERGYSKSDVTKILGGNVIRVFKANSTK